MSGEEKVLDAEVVEEEQGQEIVPVEQAPATLFRTDDPVEVLTRATDVANALKGVLQKQGLTQTIQGREHVRVEGWQTLGAMLGVTGVCVWTHKLDNGWEARVEARTLDGRVIGAAEAECLRSESTWKSRDDYALRSMAQTRATSKALGSALRFVVTLAGYEGTPAEEMAAPPPDNGGRAEESLQGGASQEQVDKIIGGFKVLKLPYSEIGVMLGSVGAEKQKINRPDSIEKAVRALTPEQAGSLIGELEREAVGNSE